MIEIVEQKDNLLSIKKVKENNILQLLSVTPKTINQQKIFDAYDTEKHLFIHGFPGTGKTFLGLYLALDSVVEEKEYDKVIIVRSSVPSRRQGFLPGSEEEKNEIFEIPYIALVNELYNRSDAYKLLKNREQIKFLSTSYLRGITLDNAVIIIDEVQNCNFMELHTIITRVGNNCRVIICGDTSQNDLKYLHEDSCIDQLFDIINKMPSFFKIEMEVKDICRNKIVKEWILASQKENNL